MKYIENYHGIKVIIENNTEKKYITAILKKYFIYKYRDPITNLISTINVYENIDKNIYLPPYKFKQLYNDKNLNGEYINEYLSSKNIIF